MTSDAVVVVPVHKVQPSDDEWLALRQAVRVLAAHQVHLVVPHSLDVSAYTAECPSLIVTRVAERFFGSVSAHNRMLMSSEFYERFDRFDYLLVHHLDAFVFRDELRQWCDRGYDYLGPPWFDGFDRAAPDARLFGVGNGGFSLRKVSSFARVARLMEASRGHGLNRLPNSLRLILRRTVLPLARAVRMSPQPYERLVGSISAGFQGNEDLLWGLRVPADLPWFRVVPPIEAMHFAFENHPARLYEMSGGSLPFGCHGWPRYDRAFWAAFIGDGTAPADTS